MLSPTFQKTQYFTYSHILCEKCIGEAEYIASIQSCTYRIPIRNLVVLMGYMRLAAAVSDPKEYLDVK